MDLAWLTDIHLNFLRHAEACKAFGRYVAVDLQGLEKPHVIVTGDIAECLSLVPMFYEFIEGLNEKRKIPTYFVLGNHDAYGGSIAASHVGAEAIEKIAKKHGNTARWLTNAGVIELSETVALMGHDGWYDGRYGSPESSRVELTDFQVIEELSSRAHASGWYSPPTQRVPLPRPVILERIREIADRCAEEAAVTLQSAGKYKKVIFATHVPPFKQACWHQGNISDNNWLPWFTNKAMGDMLLDAAYAHQDVEFQVLCGHTHSPGEVHIASNLTVLTGAAKYGLPNIYKVLHLD